LDDNLSERKLDINKEIIKLIKIQESPLNIKQMFILTYFFNKFEVDFSTIPLFSNNQQKLNHIILESIDYSQNALSSKYDIDISLSGTTLCSALIIGNILYIINIGDSRAILGTYNSRINKWKITQLSVDHKPNHPNENRRIIVYNGRIERHKNEFGDEVGPYRIYGKDSDSNGQGLTMSRSIGDLESKKYGVIYDPDVFKYELKENDKVIVIGSDGLWEQLKNEEVIEIIGECLNKDLKAKEASEILVEKARKKFLDEYKRKNKKYNYEHNLSDNYYHFNNDKNHEINSDKTNYKNSYIDDITCIVVFLDVEDKK
jgi:serine/threonine protein phosphatase PrpC